MPFMQSLAFVFDGNYSGDLGIVNVHVNSTSNLYQEPLTGKRTIVEVKTRNNPSPYFMNVDYDPIEFTLEIAFENGFTDEQLSQVARLFITDNYKELYFIDRPDRRFYVITIDIPTIEHNGAGQGFLTLKLRNISGFAFSPAITSQVFDFSQTGSGTFTLENKGDWLLKPEIWITKVTNGDFTIVNENDGGNAFTFTSLVDGEVVYVDNEYQYIQTSLSNTYRYVNFNNGFLKMPIGTNTFQVTGKATFQFRYQYKLLV